jgi:hypothetical protein
MLQHLILSIFLLLISLISSHPSFARECSVEFNAYGLIREALDKQIDVELLKKQGGMIDGYIRHAEKFLNPELEHFTTTGPQYGSYNITSETRLWFHLQTWGKRHKRGDVIRADRSINDVNVLVEETRVVRALFLTMLRHKQIEDEIGRLKSIREVISDLMQKYKKVGFLSAEQTMEKGSLEIADEDLSLNITQLQNEHHGIKKYYQTITRSECEVKLDLGKSAQNVWPDLSGVTFVPAQSLFTKLSELALEKSKLQFRLEQANAVPDVRVGPIWQLNEFNRREYNLFGVGFIVPLPIFDRNQGLKSAASIDIDRNQKRLDFNQIEMSREFKLNHRRYMNLFKQIMEFRKDQSLKAQVLTNRDLFKRGLISIPLFLTYKREQVGIIEKMNTLELDLGSYLSEIFIINNIPLATEGTKVLSL